MLHLFAKRNIEQPAGVEIRQSNIHGRGVFACKKIKPGAVIETAPLILLSAADKEYLQATMLYHYYFVIDNAETPAALGLGYSSVYNHSYSANAVYTVALEKCALIIKACKAILPGEEITLNYNGTPDDASPVYFQPETV